MSDDRHRNASNAEDGHDVDERHDDDGDAILSRRKMLIRKALVGAGLSLAVAGGCDDQITRDPGDMPSDTQPEVCLSPPPPDMDASTDQDVADSNTPEDIQPEVCLSRPLDVFDADDTAPDQNDVQDANDAMDSAPEVCLSPPPPDATDTDQEVG